MSKFKFSVKLVNNKHSVVAACQESGEEFLYFSSEHGLHTAQAVRETIARDTARGFDFSTDGLKVVNLKFSKKNKPIRFTA